MRTEAHLYSPDTYLAQAERHDWTASDRAGATVDDIHRRSPHRASKGQTSAELDLSRCSRPQRTSHLTEEG